MKPQKAGIYIFTLKFAAGKAGKLHFFPGEGGTVNGASVSVAAASTTEGTALFYSDKECKNQITSVTAEDDLIYMAAAFEAGTTYTPVVAVESTSGDDSDDEKEDEEKTTPTSNKGSGGCDAAGLGSAALLALYGLALRRRRR